jgi:hypothetical protein
MLITILGFFIFYNIVCYVLAIKMNYDTGGVLKNGGWIMLLLAPIVVPAGLVISIRAYRKSRKQ